MFEMPSTLSAAMNQNKLKILFIRFHFNKFKIYPLEANFSLTAGRHNSNVLYLFKPIISRLN